MAKEHGRGGQEPAVHGRGVQRKADEDRHEKAGLPREHVEADDVAEHPGDPGYR
jgi:hypothetical protein